MNRSEVPAGELTILPEDERARPGRVESDCRRLRHGVLHRRSDRRAGRTRAGAGRGGVAGSLDQLRRPGRAPPALASHLRTLGVGPGVIVGLAAVRSIDLMVGLLGILKAGGATCRSIPTTHADRLAFMIEDSRAPLVVTQRAFAAIVPSNRGSMCRADTGTSRRAARPLTLTLSCKRRRGDRAILRTSSTRRARPASPRA